MELTLDALRLPRAAEAATMPAVAVNDCTDGELIRRTGDGDRSAVEVLYRRYARPVFGRARQAESVEREFHRNFYASGARLVWSIRPPSTNSVEPVTKSAPAR